jgi:hypothetical protein
MRCVGLYGIFDFDRRNRRVVCRVGRCRKWFRGIWCRYAKECARQDNIGKPLRLAAGNTPKMAAVEKFASPVPSFGIMFDWLKSPKVLERAQAAAKQMRYLRLFSERGRFQDLISSATPSNQSHCTVHR